MAPQPNGQLRYAKATLNTAAGRYKSGWSIRDDGVHFEFVIPFNAEAELVLPNAEVKYVMINGETLNTTGLNYYEQDRTS